MRRRLRGALLLVAYLLVATGLPLVHLRLHAAGVAHRHDGGGIVLLHRHAGGDAAALLHGDLEALGLHDVAEAGVAAPDCRLAALVGVACDEAPSFAALALAHTTGDAPGDDTSDHGRGDPSHLRGFALVAQTLILPAPARVALPPSPAPPSTWPPAIALRRPSARGPPAAPPPA